MKKGVQFLVWFLVLWSAVVLTVDFKLGYGIYQQWRSRGFAETAGRVLWSEVTQTTEGRRTQYRAQVRYEYRVDGKRYESDVVRGGRMSDSEGQAARDTVRANPPGLIRPVYYDPARPSHAVLERTVGGQQLFVAVFLTPFNAVIVFLLGLVLAMKGPIPVAGGATIRAVGGQLHVNYRRFSRLAVAAGIFGAVSFLGIFVLAIFWKLAPPPEVALGVWGVAAVVAMFSFWLRGDGTADVIVDPSQSVISLRHGLLGSWSAGREWKRAGRPRLGVPFERVVGVEVRERILNGSDRDSRSHVPVLVVRDRGSEAPTEYDMGTWLSEEHAQAFARWLRETLALPARPMA